MPDPLDREKLLKYCSSSSSASSSSESLPSFLHDDAEEIYRPFRSSSSTARALAPAGRRRRSLASSVPPRNVLCALLTGFVAVVGFLVIGFGRWGLGLSSRAGQPDWDSEGWYPSPRGGTLRTWEESYRKAARLVGEMSLIEKVNITTGTGWMQGPCVGNTGPAINVGFPSICLQDGPLGLRKADNATAFPAGLTVAATWNPELMYKRGSMHGLEAREKGIHVILGPVMGPLGRMPAGGRNWEGFSPDPYLSGVAAVETIRGLQDQHVIATAKHYIFQEQEHYRQANEWGNKYAISSNVDDRTLHELYLWPFAESVKAGVGSVMCSYQMSNNTYTCGNSKLLNGVLKDELGFQGFVQSDWLAARSGVDSVIAGLDMAMPGEGLQWANGNPLMGYELTRAVMNSSVPMERLNDMALRIVATWYQLGQDDKSLFPDKPNFSSWTDDKVSYLYPGSMNSIGGTERSRERGVVNMHKNVRGDHHDVARAVAAEGTVLCKNSGILPLSRDALAGKRIGIYGEDAGSTVECEDRGCNIGTLGMGWGSGSVRLFPYIIDPLSALSKEFDTLGSQAPTIDYILDNDALPAIAGSAKKQDLCFAFANSDSGEGYQRVDDIAGDRNNLFLQKGGDELIQTVANNCENTIVVVHAVGPVIVEGWADLPGVKAVLLAHLPGEASGDALVDVVFGDVNPSGKLPYTVAKKMEDYGPTSGILYHSNEPVPQQNFEEGLFIDYRYLDQHKLDARWEFGYGLSYTSFQFSSPKLTPILHKSPFPTPRSEQDQLTPPALPTALPPVEAVLFPDDLKDRKVHTYKYIYPYLAAPSDVTVAPYPYPPDYDTARPPSPAGGAEGGNPSLYDVVAEIELTIHNTGNAPGQEVVQLYLGFPDGVLDDDGRPVAFPPRVLRGFRKLLLRPQQAETVTFALRRKDVSWWNVRKQNWQMPTEGKFTFWIGNSSRNLPLTLEW